MPPQGTGSRVKWFTQIYAGKRRRLPQIDIMGLFRGWLFVSKRLDPGSIHPTKPLHALAGTPEGRDDTVLRPGGLVLGCVHHQHDTTSPPRVPFHHFTFPPSKILSILLSAFYSTFPRPHRSTYIYGGRWSSFAFPSPAWVFLGSTL